MSAYTLVEIMSACACSDIAHPVSPTLTRCESRKLCSICLRNSHQRGHNGTLTVHSQHPNLWVMERRTDLVVARQHNAQSTTRPPWRASVRTQCSEAMRAAIQRTPRILGGCKPERTHRQIGRSIRMLHVFHRPHQTPMLREGIDWNHC